MEKTLETMLDHGVIDKQQLLLMNYKKVGLTDSQVILVQRIIDLEQKEDQLTINKLAKKSNLTQGEVKDLLAPLIDNKLIKITYKEKDIYFNLKRLYDRLLKTYLPPTDDSSTEEKVDWIISTINLVEKTTTRKKLKEWIEEERAWPRLQNITTSFASLGLEETKWDAFRKVYAERAESNRRDRANVEATLEIDWTK